MKALKVVLWVMVISGGLLFSNIWTNALEPHVLADASIAAVNGKDGDAMKLNILQTNKHVGAKVGGVVMMIGIIGILWVLCPKKGEGQKTVV